MKIRNNIKILINEFWLRHITRYEQYYNLSLVSYKFLILNLSLTITFIKLGTFFASKYQGGGYALPWICQGGECPPPPLYPPLCTQQGSNFSVYIASNFMSCDFYLQKFKYCILLQLSAFLQIGLALPQSIQLFTVF